MRDFYEMPHPLADYCQHAGVRKACRPCRRLAYAAAREALDGLAEWHDREATTSGPGSHYWDASNHVATSARHHRDTHYPETEDQT